MLRGHTRHIHHRKGRYPPLYKDVQGLDDWRVGVNEGYVVVGADAQLSKGLFHEGWLGHFTHLQGGDEEKYFGVMSKLKHCLGQET